jgi:hypothetical protein
MILLRRFHKTQPMQYTHHVNVRLDEVEPVIHKEVLSRCRAEVGKTIHEVSLQPIEVIQDFRWIAYALRKTFVKGQEIRGE